DRFQALSSYPIGDPLLALRSLPSSSARAGRPCPTPTVVQDSDSVSNLLSFDREFVYTIQYMRLNPQKFSPVGPTAYVGNRAYVPTVGTSGPSSVTGVSRIEIENLDDKVSGLDTLREGSEDKNLTAHLEARVLNPPVVIRPVGDPIALIAAVYNVETDDWEATKADVTGRLAVSLDRGAELNRCQPMRSFLAAGALIPGTT
ncbi:hypothetical protein FOZ61_007001, partial [Perkinsus olseni]